MITDFIERVRNALKRDGVTAAGLARRAGLHRNTLYGAEAQGWNPTATVLKALEPHIEAIEQGDWQEPAAEDEPQATPRAA